jgi:hypothetical protein
MTPVYVKCFCFKWYRKGNKKHLRFVSPFAVDETQVLPTTGGNMQSRAIMYAIGGLVFNGIFLALILIGLLIAYSCSLSSHLLLGALPYTAYLFLLNLPPLEYAGGKTDGLVYLGIKKGYDAERCMLSAMEIQGQLYEGKSFAEIDEKYYFDLPQLCEDEPLYSMILDLRYRFYLDKGELEKAADCINRLALNEEYLPFAELEKLALELVYMHSLHGDLESAEKNYAVCQNFLKEESATAKRILATYAQACGKEEAVILLLQQANDLLQGEWIAGVKKFEKNLLLRIKGE